MKKKINKRSIFNVVIVLGVVVLAIVGTIQKNNLLESSETVIGIITRVGYPGGNRIGIKEFNYSFSINGKNHKGYSKIPSKKEFEVGDSVTIRYSIEKPNISEVIF